MIDLNILETHLNTLIDSIEPVIAIAQQNGNLQQQEELYCKSTIQGSPNAALGNLFCHQVVYIPKQIWSLTSKYFIVHEIQKIENYQAILNCGLTWVGSDGYGGCDFKTYLERFLISLITKRLDEGVLSSNYITSQITIFMKEVQGQPISYTAIVEEGLEIKGPVIELKINEMHIHLRSALNKDWNRECRLDMFPFQSYNPLSIPTAILKIKKDVSWPGQILEEVEKILVLLPLYRVANLRNICTRLESGSFNPINLVGSHPNIIKQSHFSKATLLESDIDSLDQFLKEFYALSPQNIYDSSPLKKDTPLAIAHQRYCDVLVEGGIIEKRIATIVMGLESLLLFENQEVSYRFRKRGAKLLSLLIESPATEIQTILKEAYNIRSKFVHGEHLSLKSTEKLISKLPNLESIEDLEKTAN